MNINTVNTILMIIAFILLAGLGYISFAKDRKK